MQTSLFFILELENKELVGVL